MEISNLRGLSVVFMFIAFAGVCWWAFAPSRKKRFEEDANLPFADGEDENKSDAQKKDNQLHSANAENEEKRDEQQ
ncbi:CcoQ/FixQ family Cbb3-type cytochrome c oxidase assembly chaperone [Saccharophagus degradans]|uniref:Cbb3-type cytochrome oxidase component n=2 Tax=Saccharophagus degradans TaxID=86304 RepID=Q21HZ9_SACD2|nr:CcoQ/FixQ family Cbb3-type cytochrome c oxidase assembly chaperone [Saccharophagus degradans]ABD81680.1 Cbb3-type cytochrome oxidase component [Saccharophagus degradans 2-40]MBU2986443.1 CcoQ/FixQ family Cbb3-type cytochrome c oxidase assembly chaperone [Saccharophagus degradans]MDO6424517.1 CcoQ/FixQ family Cbb3-type cytochrome c oxidase assembly chaperone [Saccharophagus degradans]MDO6608860.1 CcoQ/FixQ family Cbb3-type cytochrome c oxidase assembly chaperone [Saccharophagus degradans]WGP